MFSQASSRILGILTYTGTSPMQTIIHKITRFTRSVKSSFKEKEEFGSENRGVVSSKVVEIVTTIEAVIKLVDSAAVCLHLAF